MGRGSSDMRPDRRPVLLLGALLAFGIAVVLAVAIDRVHGHSTGRTTSVPANTLYQAGSLAKLPLGRRIVVADYNGQAAVGTNYTLSILGYNARWLQYGTMGWSRDDKLIAPCMGLPADQKDYPVVVAR